MLVIGIKQETKEALDRLKLCQRDSYNDVIARLLTKSGIDIQVPKEELTGEAKVIADTCTSTESTIDREHVCTYSDRMDQEYPRTCLVCGKIESTLANNPQ